MSNHNIEYMVLKGLRRLTPKSDSTPSEIMEAEALNDYIIDLICSRKPFMITRFGSIELDASLYHHILSLPLLKRYYLYITKQVTYIHKNIEHELDLIRPLCNNAGFFPNDASLLSKFTSQVDNDIKDIDCLALNWGKEHLFSTEYKKDIKFSRLEYLEPYDYSHPWSSALRGKKVLVIHPFAESIAKQYSRRELLWENPEVLPPFDLRIIKAVQSIAGESTNYKTWFDALDAMKAEMGKTDYDIAIIGCGAYGLHLAAHAKRTGHGAIHLGGATQILFGIKGKRWDEMPAVSRFYNEYWTRPSADETPQRHSNVEGGCYW